MRAFLLRAVTVIASTFAESAEELRIHRGRVLLSLVGVGVAVCALSLVVAAGAIAEQAGREVQERAGGRPATVQYTASSSGKVDTAAASAAWERALDRHGVEFASRVGYAPITVQFADGAVPVQVQTVDADYALMHRVRLVEGDWFVERDAGRLAPAVVVNEVFWDRLGRPALASHPTVQLLAGRPATAVVVGVTPRQGEWDTEPSAYLLADAYQQLAPATDPMMGPWLPNFEAWLPPETAMELTPALEASFEAELGAGWSVDGWRSDYAAFGEDPFLPLKLMVSGVALVILLLGALGLVTIALVTVRSRIREIGVRRTFGATSGRVFFAVLMESVVGTFLAGVVGVGVAIALVRSPLLGTVLGGTEVQDLPGFPVEAALIGIGASVAVGALAGLAPALAAVRVKVIDAIRF